MSESTKTRIDKNRLKLTGRIHKIYDSDDQFRITLAIVNQNDDIRYHEDHILVVTGGKVAEEAKKQFKVGDRVHMHCKVVSSKVNIYKKDLGQDIKVTMPHLSALFIQKSDDEKEGMDVSPIRSVSAQRVDTAW